jgi:Flp pilus assembly protein TadB
LLGTGVPVLLKAYESISIKSKAKELDRIEDLVALMKKTKKEQVLSESTMAAVCSQIEVEIQSALESLAKSREHRQLVLNRKRERRDPDLTLARSLFLLYRPHGFRGWSAQVLAYVFAVLCLGFAMLIPIDLEGWLFAFSFSVLALFLCLLFRRWAVAERRRWRKAHDSGTLVGSPSMFFRPRDLRGWVALLVPLT